MKDKLFDKPIIVLPEAHKEVKLIKMQPSELVLNAAMELCLKELRSTHFPVNDPRTKLCNPFAQLTRLRQWVFLRPLPVMSSDICRFTANADIISQQILVGNYL
jgi:hypothetical protein